MRLGSTATLTRGVTAVASVSTTERLVFIKKVYSLLALSMVTAAVGAYLGSGPLLLLVAPNLMLFFILEFALIIFASFVSRKPGLNMCFDGNHVCVSDSLRCFLEKRFQFHVRIFDDRFDCCDRRRDIKYLHLLFSGFILYDTSNILRYYGTDEHVSATLALYLDVLNLFIALLSILGIMSDD